MNKCWAFLIFGTILLIVATELGMAIAIINELDPNAPKKTLAIVGAGLGGIGSLSGILGIVHCSSKLK